jgi:hypothetical protein
MFGIFSIHQDGNPVGPESTFDLKDHQQFSAPSILWVIPTLSLASMDGVGDVKHIQIKLFDNPVQMDLDKILYG